MGGIAAVVSVSEQPPIRSTRPWLLLDRQLAILLSCTSSTLRWFGIQTSMEEDLWTMCGWLLLGFCALFCVPRLQVPPRPVSSRLPVTKGMGALLLQETTRAEIAGGDGGGSAEGGLCDGQSLASTEEMNRSFASREARSLLWGPREFDIMDKP